MRAVLPATAGAMIDVPWSRPRSAMSMRKTVDLAHDLGDAPGRVVQNVNVPGLHRNSAGTVWFMGEGLGDDRPGILHPRAVLVP